jgi:RHS repeat-associated protein
MLRSSLPSVVRARTRLLVSLLAVALAVLALWIPRLARAGDTPKPPVAPPGPGPVARALPASALPNHGYPAGQRPPVVPPETKAGNAMRRLSAGQWAAVRKPGTTRRPQDGPPPSVGGAQNVLARPGFALDDTSLVVYFDIADPGLSNWSSWLVTVYDPDTQAAQDSKPLSPDDATGARCAAPRTYCRSFGTLDGWSLVDGHGYFVTVTATLRDGTQVVSDPSAVAKARTVASPPALPAEQAAGCTCPDILAPTAASQAVRGSGVQTGTGGFTTTVPDLKMAGFGVTFEAVRRYSSTNTTAGTLGLGWSWTYDVRVIPPAAGQGAVTVRAEDGAQAVYQRAADGSYTRPPGVRSTLSATATGWRLTTPDQISYDFDATGRLTSIHNARGLGTSVVYTATKWTITDAAGHKVTIDLGSDGLVKAITLPDGRAVKYQYHNGQLSAATDATGATWSYGYTGGLLTTVTDPEKRAQVTNTYTGGRVSGQVDATGAATTFRWDATNQEAKTTDADGVVVYDGYKGNVLVYTQNANGDASSQRYDSRVNPDLNVDPQGNQTAKGYDPAGNPTATTVPDPFGFTMSSTFDAHNNVTASTDGLGHTTAYGYTAFDELQTITDATGGVTKRTYDNRGLVTSETDPRGKVTKMTYDSAGNLVSRTTPMGEKTTYAYDSTGRVTSMTDPRGNLPGAKASDFTTRYAYDALDRLRKRFDPGKKQPTETVYDDLGQMVKGVDPAGDTAKYAYAKVIGRTTSVTDPLGQTLTYTYTAAGRRKSVTDAAGDRTTFAYDTRGNLVTVVSPRGNVKGANPADFTTTYVYDSNNRLVRTEHAYPGGGFAQVDSRYDELGRPTATVDPFGKSTSTGYDNDSRVVSTVDALGQTTMVGYDDAGRPNSLVLPAGGHSVTTYDPAGNPVRRTSASGGVTTWTHNDDGQVATTVEARGNAPGANPADYTTTYAYDAARNLVAVTDPLGHTVRSAYDANNRQVSATDANGHVTRFQYDDADRVTSVTGPDAPHATVAGPANNPPRPVATTYAYDADSQLTSRTDPNGHTMTYAYDKARRLSVSTDPLGRQTTFGYDAEGDLTRMVTPGPGDPAARTVVTTYDILDRKVGQDLGGTVMYAWGYDAKDRLTSLADGAGLRLQAYDDAGRLTTVSRGTQSFGYGYDKDGNVTSRTWPDGTTVTATFNDADQMTALTAKGGVAGGTAASYTFGYDPAGRLASTTDTVSGTVTDRGYDRAGRLTDVNSHNASGTVARFQLGLDPVGNPTSVVTTRGATSQTVGYTYDAADRVTGACVAAPACTGKAAYTYDAVGNRLSQTVSGSSGTGTTTYAYDKADELTRATTKGGPTVDYAYDGEGNQTKAGADMFAYNLDHTLAAATVGGVRTSYTYDAQGLQLSAVTNAAGGPRSRSWDTDVNGGRPLVAVETNATPTGSISRGYLSGPGGNPLALLAGGAADTYLPDWLGGVADVVSPQGKPVAAYDFDPYGNPRTDGTASNTPSTVDNPVRFAGMYQDGTLGSRYGTETRGYDPATGRFDGPDPLPAKRMQPASSEYAYTDDRPTVMVDPSGRDWCPDPGGCETPPQPPEGWCADPGGCVPATPVPPPAPLQTLGRKAAPDKPTPTGKTLPVCMPGDSTQMCQGPNQYVGLIVSTAEEAGIDPRLLLAILHIENGQWSRQKGSKRQQVQGLAGKGSIGMANMDLDTFTATKRNHPNEIPEWAEWEDMLTQDDLAITAAAYRLRDLIDALPAEFQGSGQQFSQEELAAVGYNTGQENMFKVAMGTQTDPKTGKHIDIGPAGYGYLYNGFHPMWDVANKVICQSGYYTC